MIDHTSEAGLRAAIELMYFAYRGFTSRADKILEQRGLGRVHHRILYFIGRNPNLAVGQLIEILAVSKQALNAPLRQLIEMNLVCSLADTADRRIKRLLLTEGGRRLEAALTGAQIRQLKAVFATLGTEKANGWHSIMAALSASGNPNTIRASGPVRAGSLPRRPRSALRRA
jgi:DNA-binding MarR family transcriptional regulator